MYLLWSTHSTIGNYRLPDAQPTEDGPLSSEPCTGESFLEEEWLIPEESEMDIENTQPKKKKMDPIDNRINNILDRVEDMVCVFRKEMKADDMRLSPTI